MVLCCMSSAKGIADIYLRKAGRMSNKPSSWPEYGVGVFELVVLLEAR